MNESAFPIIGHLNPDNEGERFAVYNPGLSKRELFAAMVLQGVLSIDAQRSYEASALFAVKAADELISQLNASKGEG